MKQEIIEKTYELVDEMKEKPSYKRLLELKDIIDNDKDIQNLIYQFHKLSEKYEEVTKYSTYHPDLKKVQKEFSEAKEKLYMNEFVKEYKTLEKSFQKDLDKISRELAVSISKKIKYPNEIGLINKH